MSTAAPEALEPLPLVCRGVVAPFSLLLIGLEEMGSISGLSEHSQIPVFDGAGVVGATYYCIDWKLLGR